MGLARSANITSVKQKPVVGIGDILFWYVFGQRHLHLIWCIVALADESQPMGHPIDMCIHS
jgi:hypothetical protein